MKNEVRQTAFRCGIYENISTREYSTEFYDVIIYGKQQKFVCPPIKLEGLKTE